MDQPLPAELDKIQDPETGLALLSKLPKRLFWQFQFTQWRDWRAGDVLAFGRAIDCCSLLNKARRLSRRGRDAAGVF